jgi:hypothetical protein
MLVLHLASVISITFQFAMAGLAKVFGDLAMVETFATIGAGQWFKSLLGSLEIASALGALLSRLSALDAAGSLPRPAAAGQKGRVGYAGALRIPYPCTRRGWRATPSRSCYPERRLLPVRSGRRDRVQRE